MVASQNLQVANSGELPMHISGFSLHGAPEVKKGQVLLTV